MRYKELLTTGDVAKLCGCAPRTVSKWIDGGELKGYRLPGSQDRRIHRADLEDFARQHGMPLVSGPRHLTPVVLAVGCPVGGTLDVVVHETIGAFDAGYVLHQREPDIVVVDAALGRVETTMIAQRSRRYRPGVLVFLATTEDAFDTNGVFDGVVRTPVKAEALMRIWEGVRRG
jgi:excisionase family DNA binding protein